MIKIKVACIIIFGLIAFHAYAQLEKKELALHLTEPFPSINQPETRLTKPYPIRNVQELTDSMVFAAFVLTADRRTGEVVINGYDGKRPKTPFAFIWGDGTTSYGKFIQTHTYADCSKRHLVKVVATHAHNKKDTAQVTVDWNYAQDHQAKTLSVWVTSIDLLSGVVALEGNDTRSPMTPFLFLWGDGTSTSSFFPVTHTYTSHTKNYKVAVVANYKDSQRDTAHALVDFEQLNSRLSHLKILEYENELKSSLLREKNLQVNFLLVLAFVILATAYTIYTYRKRYLTKIYAIDTQQKLQVEKDRISKDLHDSIGSQLTSLSLGLRDQERKKMINATTVIQIENDISQIRSELRDMIWTIKEEEIALENLADKLRNMFWQHQQKNEHIAFEVSVLPEMETLKIKTHCAVNLFRILQETTNNSLKHSNGTAIKINIDCDGKERWIFQALDNGTGFNTEAQHPSDHYGLQNMKKRAADIGAVLDIRSDHNGTITTIILPANFCNLRLA
ncbi:MAG: hypothetical protein JST43_04170 [Bacteroidetes bacterium]|nr:hypothetical protein [Bacteroidota bacterium]MBS1539982.1 hypothetical protein [Bacteroidota bacterium]